MTIPTDFEGDNFARVAEHMRKSRRIVVLTGAGVSKESGIATFRDAQTGLWAAYDPQTLATPEGFLADPALVWKWYDYRRKLLQDVQPNAGHFAIAELERYFKVAVVTQNVDRLHQRAGSTDVIELHGNITSFYCFDHHHESEHEISFDLDEPPHCHCGSLMRPAVVWFGEMLPADSMERASKLMNEADLLFVVGTSGLVQPAASLPLYAKSRGVTIVEVNPEKTPNTHLMDIYLRGPSGEVLPRVLNIYKASTGITS